jgi:aspartate kinase
VRENKKDFFGSPFVVKFGGSSLANGEKISNAVKAIMKELEKGTRIVVVVSALGKTTDFLLNIIKETINCNCNCNTASLSANIDDVLAMGERTSARIFSTALKSVGIRCRCFDPSDLDWPIITNDRYLNADPILSVCEERIVKYVLPLLKEGVVAVIPGFIGKTLDGKITTIGRGGSDTTALILARALKTTQVIIVTDVHGVMTADPKLVKSARKIPEIDVNSLLGLTSCGQKFLQRKTLKYKEEWVDIKIINNNHCDLNAEGTIVRGSLTNDMVHLDFEEAVASVTIVGKGISRSSKVLQEINQKIRNAKVSLLGISADYDSLILYIPEKALDKILEPIHSIILENSEALAMAVRKNLALLKIKTAEFEDVLGILGILAQNLREKNINIYGLSMAASRINVLVDMAFVEGTLKAIKQSVSENFETEHLESCTLNQVNTECTAEKEGE